LTSGKVAANVNFGFLINVKQQNQNIGNLYAYYYWWLSAEGEARSRLFGV
jgi:hypothetical protein